MEIDFEYGESVLFETPHEDDKFNEKLFAKIEQIRKSVEDLLAAA